MSEVFYEREGAVFRNRDGVPLEIFGQHSGKFSPYTGDSYRVLEGGPYGGASPVTLDEARVFMDAPPVDYPEQKAA